MIKMGSVLELSYEMKDLILQSDKFPLEELRSLYAHFRRTSGMASDEFPKVSVLLPVYKTNGQYLYECIQSVLNQTYPHWELLILNDCPEDNQILLTLKRFDDARIFYKKNDKNIGIARTRNKLMTWASGKYFAVLDHDDVMLPERLERQVIHMEFNPDIGILGSAYKRFGNWRKSGVVRPTGEADDIKAGLFFKCTMHHPGVLIRAKLIQEHKIAYNPEYVSANDRCLYLDMMPYATLCNLPSVLMRYRIHPKMTSKQKRREIVREQKKLRSVLLKRMGVKLNPNQFDLLNSFVLKGRCRIKNKETLKDTEKLLCDLNNANFKSGYFPKESFSKLCAEYFIKRCVNAAFWGGISSADLLKQTTLPVQQVKIPPFLKIFNFITPSK